MTGEADSYELLGAARRGDREALDVLVRRHMPALRAFVRAHADPTLRRRESASDLVQSACRQALTNLDGFEWRGEGSFRRWLCTVAMNIIRNKQGFHRALRRDMSREVRDADVQDSQEVAFCYRSLVTPSRQLEASEELARVEQVLDRLAPEQKTVIVWHRFVGLSHAEIATELGKSVENVRQILVRALASFATCWASTDRPP